MKHDRSIINAKGGNWPTIADAVQADAKAIATGHWFAKGPAPPIECDELAKRRKALGMTAKQFARAAKMNPSTVWTVEVGTSGAEALQRYRAALEKLEGAE
jgi:DNA-binding transcriptional regulator YiaG